MNNFLFTSFFALSFAVCNLSSYAGNENDFGQRHTHLAVLHIPTAENAESIRCHYSKGMKQMQDTLWPGKNQIGRHWFFYTHPADQLHLTLLTFQQGNYGSEHIGALRNALLSTTSLVPQDGKFFRTELWLKSARPDGTTSYTHWVHSADLTNNEKQANSSAPLHDSAVRSLEMLTPDFKFESGHIILRYGTNGRLSTGVDELNRNLGSDRSPPGQLIYQNREAFGSNHLGHMTIARFNMATGSGKAPSGDITDSELMQLKRVFEGFRTNIGLRHSDQNTHIPYTMRTVHLTTGIRDTRKVQFTLNPNPIPASSGPTSSSHAEPSSSKPISSNVGHKNVIKKDKKKDKKGKKG